MEFEASTTTNNPSSQQHHDSTASPSRAPDPSLYRWQGHKLSGNTPTTCFRLSFLNVHGLRKYGQSLQDSLMDLLALLQIYDISITGISEHHLPMAHPGLRHRLHESFHRCRQERGGMAYHFSSGPDVPTTEKERLMGGTGIILTNECVGRIEPKGLEGDHLGRWSTVHLRRKRSLAPLSIISIYQVCPSPTNAIGNTAWHQQRRALDLDGKFDLHPRISFRNDLFSFLHLLQQKGHDVIVGGDWNDSMADTRSTQLWLCTQLDLVDPWMAMFPDHPEFPTYERGQKRIDSVLFSRRLLPAIHRIGYTPVGMLADTDHRGVIIELHAAEVFGDDLDLLRPTQSRGIRSHDRSAVNTYIEMVHRHLHAQNAFQRGLMLSQPRYQRNSKSDAEALDQLVGEAFRLGESRCFRRRSQWFSRALVQKRFEVSCLRFYRNGLKCGFNRHAVVQQKLAIAQIHTELPFTLEETSTLLVQKEHDLRQLSIKSLSGRSEFLAEKAASHETQHDNRRARIVRAINRFELAQKTWRQLAFLTTSGSQHLDRLEIPASWPSMDTTTANLGDLEDPKSATEWRTVTDPTSIEQYLMLRNRLHFGQAQGTPFTVDPLVSSLDWGATTSVANSILDGCYVPPTEVTPLCRSVLLKCKASAPQDQIPAEISLLAFAEKITKWNEKTTTSPSGRHLGHYKALFAQGLYMAGDPEYAEFQEKKSQIAKLLVQLINYCIDSGYVLERWKKIVNIMIFKDPGNTKIHRLRIIHIYEADFNLLLAVKWRELLHSADRKGIVNNGQYGGRPGREATTVALLEELRNDISYCTRRTLLTFDNDAASCYDRIIPSLASLINRKYGLHRKLALVHGRTLQEARYKLKTAIGVSAVEYSHSEQFPIYGTGQGSGNSPMVWLFISATLFDVYSDTAQGATFQDPSGTISVRLTLSGFVDDTNAVLNDWRPQHEHDLATLLDMLRKDAQCWNDLLFISGGRLELSKCSFHVLKFDFQPDGTPKPSRATPLPIILTDSVSGTAIQVSALAPDDPHRILGHWKAPVGSGKKQLKTITSKANVISQMITTGPFSRYGAKLVYGAKYVSSLRYVLPQCYFSATQLKKAERQSMPRIIAKCGFFRKTSYALLFAPIDHAGGGFLHWHWIQGEGQILHFLKHWRTDSDVSRTLRISLAWSQWQSGLSHSILVDTQTSLAHVESRWIPSLRDSLHMFQVYFELDQTFVPRTEREGDQYIMEVALRSNMFSPRDLRLLNYCRLYLHVTTTSELFQADGVTILPHMYKCERPPWFDPSTITVIQRQPSRYQCRTRWQRLCEFIASRSCVFGKWYPGRLRLRRETYGESQDLYHWYHGSYWRCNLTIFPVRYYTMLEPTDWSPTSLAIPIDIKTRVIKTIYLPQDKHFPGLLRYPRPLRLPQDFLDFVGTLPMWERELLNHIEWHGNTPFQLMHLWSTWSADQQLIVVSDGSSLENKTMSFGVVIGAANGNVFVTLMGPALGIPSSHRAECTGCLAGAVFLRSLQTFTRIAFSSTALFRSISDNRGMINSLCNRGSYDEVYANATLVPDWDLLEEIHSTYYKQLHLQNHTYEWVRGHQDENSTGILAVEATYNVQADSLAGDYTLMISDSLRPRTPRMSTTRCNLVSTTHSYHGRYKATLRRLVATPTFQQYLMTKHNWTEDVYNEVDWVSFRIAARNYVSTEVHLLKLVHDLLPTRHHTSKFQPWTSSMCHYCDESETLAHLQKSTCNPCSQQFQQDLPLAIQRYFNRNHTPLEFQTTFLDAVQQWLQDKDLNSAQKGRRAHRSQSWIGWHLLTRGFLSTQWRKFFVATAHRAKWVTKTTSESTDLLEEDILPDGEPPATNDCPNVDLDSLLHDNSNFRRRTIDPTVFIAGLIKTIWLEVGTLWRRHLETVHQTKQTQRSPVLLAELQTRVRVLHSLRNKVLPRHSDQYFQPDLEGYLSRASSSQLQTYLLTYYPVIMASIRAAADQPMASHLRSVFSRNQLPTVSHATVHSALEEAPHRKRNRLRSVVLVVLWIISRHRR